MQRTAINVITGEVTVTDLTPEEITALHKPASTPMPDITRRQLRLALLRLGITSDHVEARIAALEIAPIEREAAMIEWRDSNTYQRDHWLVQMLGNALGMTEAQIDAVWVNAAMM